MSFISIKFFHGVDAERQAGGPSSPRDSVAVRPLGMQSAQRRGFSFATMEVVADVLRRLRIGVHPTWTTATRRTAWEDEELEANHQRAPSQHRS